MSDFVVPSPSSKHDLFLTKATSEAWNLGFTPPQSCEPAPILPSIWMQSPASHPACSQADHQGHPLSIWGADAEASAQSPAQAVTPREVPVSPPSSLDAAAVKRAQSWALKRHLSPLTVRSLQAVVGAAATGEYDDATVQGVARAQQQKGLDADGKAGKGTLLALSIGENASQPASKKASAGGPPAGQPASDGVSVALFASGWKGKNGKAENEFERRADQYAKQYQAAGLRDDQLTWGKSTPFKNKEELTSHIQSIHAALGHWAETSTVPNASSPAKKGGEKEVEPPPAGETAPVVAEAPAQEVDRRSQIKNLAIFTHGVPHGIALQPSAGRRYADNMGLHTTHGKGRNEDPSNIEEFVGAVQDALTPDVNVLLYACSTGRDVGTEASPEHIAMPAEGERGGKKSFAHDLAKGLQDAGLDEASVYSHLIAAHTTENPFARVYGADAGSEEGEGGLHLFDMLYPTGFIDAELAQLVPDLAKQPEAQQKQMHERLRVVMWEHYKDCLLGEHHRRDKKKANMVFGRQRYMTMEAFQDPTARAAELHADFEQRWLTQARRDVVVSKEAK